MKSGLLALNEDWQVWTDWYENRLAGSSSSKELEIARVLIGDMIWLQGPKVVNARIRDLIEEYSAPEDEPGFGTRIEDGRLRLNASIPAGDEAGDPLQQRLHGIVRKRAAALVEELANKENQYPALFFAAKAYLEAVSVPLPQVDVTNVWSEGNALQELNDSYARQNRDATMSPELEPGAKGLLGSLVKDHGGFILGFVLGRELTDRADRMRMMGLLPESLHQPILNLLGEVRKRKAVFGKEVLLAARSFEQNLIELGWPAARGAYSAYAFTRTLLIGMGRAIFRYGVPPVAFLGGASALATIVGDPNLAMTAQFAQFFIGKSGDILQFAACFPELKSWLETVLDHLERDQQTHSQE